MTLNRVTLDTIIAETKIFLTQHPDIDYKSISTMQGNLSDLKLSDHAVSIYVYGNLNFTIIMSFEENLLNNIVKIFLKKTKVAECDKEEVYDSLIKETINIVAGLCLSYFVDENEKLNIAPPVRTKNEMIKKDKDMQIFSEDLITKFGKLSISIVDYKIKDI